MNADSDLKLNKPELKVDVNRDKVAAVGASVVEIGRTLETMLGGRQVTRFKRNAEQYNVKLQVADVNRRDPDDLTNIYVRGGHGEMIQLSNLVTVREDVAPRELNHFNKQRAALITASVGDGHTLGQALDVLETTTRDVMGPTAQIDYEGVAREFKDSSSKIYVTFLLALAFIYLVLAAQFESFVAPFVIILSVPLAMAGALLALKLSGGSLNIYSQIGLITLVGLITKHGILIVEFSNQLRAAGRADHGSGARSERDAAAADPDDDRRNGARRRAACDGDRSRRRSAQRHRLGHRRRHDGGHAVHVVRRADGVHVSRAPHAAPRRAATRRNDPDEPTLATGG